MKIGIVAPSSQVPSVELALGVQKLTEAGFHVKVHPQCRKSHLFFAGEDQLRAQAFYDYASSSQFEALWCARGGYGAVRILPLLEKLTIEKGIPSPKLLIGYSDVTALMEFVQKKWGWSVLHAPLPSLRKFSILPERDWSLIQSWVKRQQKVAYWEKQKLKLWSGDLRRGVSGPLVGGNLTVWTSLLGTPFQGEARDCILFFEDVEEALYRMDRMLQQLYLSGSLNHVRAIVLGNFLNCRDYSSSVLAQAPSKKTVKRVLEEPRAKELKPLRKVYPAEVGLRKIWTDLGEALGVPVLFGLPVGHGPEVAPLPMGAQYEITPQGHLKLIHWNWLSPSPQILGETE